MAADFIPVFRRIFLAALCGSLVLGAAFGQEESDPVEIEQDVELEQDAGQEQNVPEEFGQAESEQIVPVETEQGLEQEIEQGAPEPVVEQEPPVEPEISVEPEAEPSAEGPPENQSGINWEEFLGSEPSGQAGTDDGSDSGENYRLENGEFIQLLNWENVSNALFYRVEIEELDSGRWNRLLQEETETPSIELTLPAGNYRYRVTVYDFLERPGAVSNWAEFEILLAIQPELSRFGPEGFYLDEDLSWYLDVAGRNLLQNTIFYLESQGGRNRVRPVSVVVEQRGNVARLTFDVRQLEVGSYDIYAVNPGGLSSNVGVFAVSFRKPVDIEISGGYLPLIPLYGKINSLLDGGIYPLGVYAKLAVMPFKRNWGYLGIELRPSWNYISVDQSDFTVSAHLLGGEIFGVYQRMLANRVMAFRVRVGGGIYSVLNYHFSFAAGTTPPLKVLIPAASAGASFHWFFLKSVFLETGLEYTHMFSVDNPMPGYLKIFLGIGRQF
jgi:hypothetical protein